MDEKQQVVAEYRSFLDHYFGYELTHITAIIVVILSLYLWIQKTNF